MTNDGLRCGADDGRLELWAGVEATVNRVGDRFFDQTERSGHARRLSDLDLLAWMGARAVRYPVLWERTAPGGVERAEWAWADERLGRLRELGIRPIATLLHHGSGPRDTHLLDPEFPVKLATYARAVAERFPWLEDYTPVNEPLTTARFSALYGHWYPHLRDERAFLRALLNQLRGTILAMRAIREVNPRARLIQTEDLGKTHSTPRLVYQAAFENVRRWLTFDLLCGRVDRDHPLWLRIRGAGVSEAELDLYLAEPCPPDVIGINHYVTSERYLDERLHRFPACCHGGNGQDTYADVEAVRVGAAGCAGPGRLLREAWSRYGLPLAVTEAHLGCTREEQVRWLHDVWTAASSLRDEGADVRAVTVWSVFGAYDWNSLLTRDAGVYEPGAFDLRAERPRPTAIARMARDLAERGAHEHPALGTPGWWRRLDRVLYPPVSPERNEVPARWVGPKLGAAAGRPILITGATGTLGRAFARLCRLRGLPFRLTSRADMDIGDPASVWAALEEIDPWAVVNTAGYVRVDDAEGDERRCMRENAFGPLVLADACARRGARLLTFSSDLVFDGSKFEPYVESDAPAPLCVYGASKATAERQVLEAAPEALVVRTSAFFGPWDEHNFVVAALRTVRAGAPFTAAEDATVSPTYVPDLVHACLDLLVDGETGIWHLANAGAVTWADFARDVVDRAGLDASLVLGQPTGEIGLAARRPLRSALASERASLMPSLEDAIARYFAATAEVSGANQALGWDEEADERTAAGD